MHSHSHSGCVCGLAAGLIPDSTYAALEHLLKLPADPVAMRLRGGAPNDPKCILIKNASIWTADPNNPTADSLAIDEKGMVLAVGSEKIVREKLGGQAVEEVDMEGKFVCPGFVEPHMHPTIGGIIHDTSVDVYPFSVASIDDALAKIAAKSAELDAQNAPDTVWVTANGYDQALTPPYRAITRDDLDKISTRRPIFITSNTLHTGYANSKAMEVVGVTEESATHADYRRDANGKLTGVVVEAALWSFQASQPPPSAETILSALHSFLLRAARKGCTTVIDAAMGFRKGTMRGDLAVYMQLAREGRLVCRVGLSPVASSLEDAVEVAKEGRQREPGEPVFFDVGDGGKGLLSLHAIKFVLDGTNQTATAFQSRPYLIHPGVGEPNYTPSTLLPLVHAVKNAGFSAMMHANGDAAIDMAIQAYREVYGECEPERVFSGRGWRGRVEHCTICREDQVEEFKKLNIVPSFLMQHLLYWGSTYRDKILGPERAERMDPAGDCEKHNVLWTMHCDNPVTPIQPLQYIETAVTRRNYYDSTVLGPSQRVSVEAALKAVTINGAIESGLGEVTGSLVAGKSADLVVLEKSVFEVGVEEIKGVGVRETWLGGRRMVWD